MNHRALKPERNTPSPPTPAPAAARRVWLIVAAIAYGLWVMLLVLLATHVIG